MADHCTHFSENGRKSRNPSTLFVNSDIGIDHINLLFRYQHGSQRMQGPEGVPAPVVHIKIMFPGFMDFTVVHAEVFAIFGDIDHPFKTSVKEGIKNCLLVRSASFDPDLTQGIFPFLPGLLFYLFYTLSLYFVLKILLSLFNRNVGDPGANGYHTILWQIKFQNNSGTTTLLRDFLSL